LRILFVPRTADISRDGDPHVSGASERDIFIKISRLRGGPRPVRRSNSRRVDKS
jgi:hypothetical protein